MIKKKISVVIPVYNAENTIKELSKSVFNNLLENVEQLHLILVNDGSTDNSGSICLDLASNNENITYIELAKNFGEHHAILAGLHYVDGDYVVLMDDDFQNPPEEIIKLINEIHSKDYDVVYSKFLKKEHHYLRNIGSRFINYVAFKVFGKPKDLYLSSFKILNRFAVSECIKYKGPFPYLDGIIFNITRNVGSVLVEHRPRLKGESGYTFPKLVSLWSNLYINHSIFPMRLISIIGLFIFISSAIFLIWVIIEKLINPDLPAGWSSVIGLILLFSGMQFLFIGLIGEYLGRLFLTNNNKPQFIVRKKI